MQPNYPLFKDGKKVDKADLLQQPEWNPKSNVLVCGLSDPKNKIGLPLQFIDIDVASQKVTPNPDIINLLDYYPKKTEDNIYGLACFTSKNGSFAITGSRKSFISIVNLKTQKLSLNPKQQQKEKGETSIQEIAVKTKGTSNVAILSWWAEANLQNNMQMNSGIDAFDLDKQQIISSIPSEYIEANTKNWASSLSLSPDNKKLQVGLERGGFLQCYDLPNLKTKPVISFPANHSARISKILVSEQDYMILSVSLDQTAKMFDIRKEKIIKSWNFPFPIYSAACTADWKSCYFGCESGGLYFDTLDDMYSSKKKVNQYSSSIMAVFIPQDSTKLIYATSTSEIGITDITQDIQSIKTGKENEQNEQKNEILKASKDRAIAESKLKDVEEEKKKTERKNEELRQKIKEIQDGEIALQKREIIQILKNKFHGCQNSEKELTGFNIPTNHWFDLKKDPNEKWEDFKRSGFEVDQTRKLNKKDSGFGDIYEGKQQKQNGINQPPNVEIIAVKESKRDLFLLDKFYDILTEPILLLKCDHKNIITCKGYQAQANPDPYWSPNSNIYSYNSNTNYLDSAKLFILLEKLEMTLGEYMSTKEFNELPHVKKLELCIKIAEGINQLHEEKNVVHSDIKLNNIMLDMNKVPKIIDLGISKYLGPTNKTLIKNWLAGECQLILPPEQLKEGATSSKFDIYSFGLIIYQVFLGKEGSYKNKVDEKTKFFDQGNNPKTNISNDLDNLIARCLEFDRTLRPNSRELLQELNKLKIEWQFLKL